jgi:HK97 family phage portal protein
MNVSALPRRIAAAAGRRLMKAITPLITKALAPVDGSRSWWPVIREFSAGAWQSNITVDVNHVLSNHADFACKTLIASDIAKLRVKLVQKDRASGVWIEVDNFNFRVLVKPNHFQTRIQFFESWLTSKLQRGNAYVLKVRDSVEKVIALYVLDPGLVRPMVAEDGSVFYELRKDNLSGLDGQTLMVPASEIIHDRINCLFHPLVGVSPIFAAGLAAMQGLTIQEAMTNLFQNGARPSGVLTAPGSIGDDTAARLKEYFDTNFSGANAGKVAVVGDGLTYMPMTAKAVDAQLIEQLKWTAEVVCSVYHVPPYKIGIGTMPSYNNNIQSLNVEYYSQCLQRHIEDIEILLDEGLGLNGEGGRGATLGTEFDVDGLLRMDSTSLFEMLDKGKSVMTLDERRRRIDLPKLSVGGGTVYLQQQDHSVEAIAARDERLINPPQVDLTDDESAEAAKAYLYAEFRELPPVLALPKPKVAE